jgi:hypothetical protein
MILPKGMGAVLALAVMAGFAGQASADVREYCDSYAHDVANRKTNGVADGSAGTVGHTVLGAGVTNDRFKRAYTNAFERCVNNYEGTRNATAQDATTDQKPADKKAAVSETTDKQAAASGDTTDGKVAASDDVTDDSAAANASTDASAAPNEAADASEAPIKPAKKKAAASEAKPKKVAAASEAKPKKVAANEAVNKDEACARKYRSYDPQIGKYKSLTGVWRPCRL